MSRIRPRAVLLMATAIVGLALAIAYNSYARVQSGSAQRSSDLSDIVEVMEGERLALEENLATLRERIAAIETGAAEEAGLAESFGRELEQVRATVGLTGLEGPGVLVTLADSAAVPQGQDPEACLIHDFDIATVVNALFAAGAEAVSVNDERVVPITAVRCAGNTILVNSRRLGNPYVVSAIGDPETLEEGLSRDETVAPLLETYPALYGLTVRVERKPTMRIPAYRGSLRTEFASALETEG